MKTIFNKSQRIYKHNGIDIKPMTKHDLPDEEADRLIAAFSHEIIEAGSYTAPVAVEKVIQEKDLKIAELEKQVKALQRVAEAAAASGKQGKKNPE